MRKPLTLPLIIIAAACWAHQAGSYESSTDKPGNPDSGNSRQYTFAWQFLDGSEMAPRGGTTTGARVDLVKAPSPEWQQLQEAGLDKKEKDRRAILAMAGP